MRIRIVGGGAVGLLLAGCLARSGAAPELVVRTDDQRNALDRQGLAVRTQEGARFVEKVDAVAFRDWTLGDPDEPAADWIFLTVKQETVTDAFAEAVASRLGSRGRVLCFQNGLGHEEVLLRHIPASRLFVAVTTEGARKHSPREVSHTGSGITFVGPTTGLRPDGDGGPDPDHETARLAARMTQAGFRTETEKNMRSRVWGKLIVNAVINPLTALMDIPNGGLPVPGHRMELMKAVYAEACEIARACGVALPSGLWETVLDVCRSTAGNRSSMLQDFDRKRHTEIDWILGSLIRQAEIGELGAPTLRTVYHLVKAREENWGGIPVART
jgi:2-dehydropantoate 2-reductase